MLIIFLKFDWYFIYCVVLNNPWTTRRLTSETKQGPLLIITAQIIRQRPNDEMRSSKESKKKTRPSSPLRDRTSPSTRFESRRHGSHSSRLSPSTSLLDRDLVTSEANLLGDLKLSPDHSVSDYNPRSFPYSVKQQCWDKAEKIKGRDPDRWRRDALGNTVFRKLVGCPGCLCHDYDHILPYSKVLTPYRFYSLLQMFRWYSSFLFFFFFFFFFFFWWCFSYFVEYGTGLL